MAIDWSSPSYPVRPRARAGLLDHCQICGKRVLVGELYRSGPRGLKVIHDRCGPPRREAPVVEEAVKG